MLTWGVSHSSWDRLFPLRLSRPSQVRLGLNLFLLVEMVEPAYQVGRTQLETVANEIQMMASHISQIVGNVPDMKSFAMGLNLRIESAGNEIQTGFATAANIQVQMVSYRQSKAF